MTSTSILLAATILSAQCLLGSCHLRHGAGKENSDALISTNTEVALDGIRKLVEKDIFHVSDLEDLPVSGDSSRGDETNQRRLPTNCDDAGGEMGTVHVE
jgi:hypothetical protein